MKKELQKKLNAYAAVAGTIAAAGAAHAQVIYTDINPDTIVHDGVSTYSLDIDNNGTPELQFDVVLYQTSAGTIPIAEVTVLGDTSNALVGSLYSNMYPLPYALNNGDSISQTNNSWRSKNLNGGLQYLGIVYGSYSFGSWVGANDKYLGVRFKQGTETHYGWVRLSVNAGVDSIIVKDYAYEALHDIGLTAGQTVGIHESNILGNVRIFASGNTVVMNDPDYTQGGTVRIMNSVGETLYLGETHDETTRISLEGNAVGIYLVEFTRGDLRTTRKVYIH